MLNIYKVDSSEITMEALEELSNDDSVYGIYYFTGYKIDDRIVAEPAYRLRRFGDYFKTLTVIQKEIQLDRIRQGRLLLVWVLDE